MSEPEVLANIHVEWLDFSAAIATAALDPPAPDLPPSASTPDVAAPAAAPTPQPVVAESAGSCHPSDDPCVPIGADADCASGSGDGSIHVAHPVRILGPDEYGLDGNDNDGLGCENE